MPKRRAPSATVQAKMVENRVRERASRYGLRLSRSRQRDSLLKGTYGVWDDQEQAWVFAGPDGWGWSLEACELFLGRLANGEVPATL